MVVRLLPFIILTLPIFMIYICIISTDVIFKRQQQSTPRRKSLSLRDKKASIITNHKKLHIPSHTGTYLKSSQR